MSATGSIFDWLWAGGNANTQSAAEQQANIQAEQAQLGAQTNARIAAGTLDPNSQEAQTNLQLAGTNQYLDPGEQAATTFFGSIGSGGNAGSGAGVGSVFTDVLIIGAIGAGIWAFFEFGGVGLLKSLTAKSKWWVLGILAGVALIFYLIWQQFQKTSNDANSLLSGVEAGGLALLNPFAGNNSSS